MKKQTETIRYAENPFIENMVIPLGKKSVRLSRMGKDNMTLVNNETGEDLGTHVSTYKKVDTEKFVKLFTKNIALTFDLTSAGIKAFSVLVWIVQTRAINKDKVSLDSYQLDEFLQAQEEDLKLSLATFKRGLAELEKSKIIAKALKRGDYFINPSFIFSGDRIAFTTVIERDQNLDRSIKSPINNIE